MKNHKRKPAYYQDFLNHWNLDFILIAKDWNAVNAIRHLLKKNCLLCENSASFYDLSFCCEREIWVVHSNPENFSGVMELAHAIQRHGAAKISVIKVEARTLQEAEYDKF